MNLPNAPGVHDITMQTSVGTVDVTLSLPVSSAEESLPLVVVLHYAGQPTPFYGRPLVEHLMLPAFSGLNAVFIAPTSLGGDWRQEHNVTAIFELAEIIEDHFTIDKAQRIITGYSMGAIGSWYLPSQRPGYFSAAIPVAGFPLPLPKCEVPTHVILSKSDEIFSLAKFLKAETEITQKVSCLKYTVINDAGHYDIAAFGEALQAVVNRLGDL